MALFVSIILFVVIIIIIVNVRNFRERRERIEALLSETRDLYIKLNKIITTSYDLKVCPSCFENFMSIESVSPTGQSIKYSCNYCDKVITARLFRGKDGYNTVRIFDDIEHNLYLLKSIKGSDKYIWDFEDSFTVIPFNSKELKKDLRSSIPESVRHEVWRRDQGKCVQCGSQKKLEFDHIIPVSKGGANTARNLQLLCENCNRIKSNKI